MLSLRLWNNCGYINYEYGMIRVMQLKLRLTKFREKWWLTLIAGL